MTILIKTSTTASFETIEIKDTPLGKGGQGAVHNIITSKYSAEYCIKLFIREADKMYEKVKYMVAHPPRNIRETSFRICWPVALAYNTKKEFVGYMMPLAFPNGHDLTILSVYRNKPLSQLKRFKDKVEWHNKYELDTREGIINRVKMLCNIAIALHSIHSTGRYVLVDLKPENIDATGNGRVSIMDADSIQISENGKILYPATAFTPEYFAPEGKQLQQKSLPFTLQCDYFAAAVCFYQILTGTHPYSGTVLKSPYDNCTEIADCISNGLFAFGEKQNYISLPTGFNLQQNFYNLPLTVQNLFKRAFGSQASRRPTMEEWGRTFHEIITGGVKVGASSIKRDTAVIPLKITGVSFSDEDNEGNEIRRVGSKLFNDVTYLCPYLSYTVVNNVGNVDLHYKIINPKGDLLTGNTTKGTLALTAKGSYTKKLSGWGSKSKTVYSTPGEYHIEFYYKGKCIYKSQFTINDLTSKTVTTSAPKVSPVRTTSVPYTPPPQPKYTYTPPPRRSSAGLWSRMNGAIEDLGDMIDDNIDSISDSGIWMIILGILGVLGLIAAAISTGSIFWGIVVAVIGFSIGVYAVTIGSFIISLIARVILNILRYILYNIYTLLITIVIILGIIFLPQIRSVTDEWFGGRNTQVESTTTVDEPTVTYYCTARSSLNIRKEPNANATVLGTLRPKQLVEVYSVNGEWATIKYNGSKAYVSSKYIAVY